jgi:hypothetical protein
MPDLSMYCVRITRSLNTGWGLDIRMKRINPKRSAFFDYAW